MNISFRRDHTGQYMLLTGGQTQTGGTFERNILSVARIEGLLQPEEEVLNGSLSYRYDVTGLLPFDSYMEICAGDASALRELFMGITACVKRLDEYLLGPEHLYLARECLFLRRETRGVMIPYVPSYSRDLRLSLLDFSESLIPETIRGDGEGIVLLGRIVRALEDNQAESGSLCQLLNASLRTDGTGNRLPPDAEEAAPSLPDADDASGMFSDPEPEFGRDPSFDPFDPAGIDSGPADEIFENLSGGSEPLPPEREDTGGHSAVRKKRAGTAAAGSKGVREKIAAFLPSKSSWMRAAGAAVPALLAFILLTYQRFVYLTVYETAGCALLLALLIFSSATLISRLRTRTGKAPQDPSDPSLESGRCAPYETSGTFSPTYAASPTQEASYAAPAGRSGTPYPSDPYSDGPASMLGRPESHPYVQYGMALPENDGPFHTGGEETTLLSAASGQEESAGNDSRLPRRDAFVPEDPSDLLPVLEVTEPTMRIGGPSSGADLVIPDDSVSRLHATITVRNGVCYLEDPGSRNGTAVDGRILSRGESVPLVDGVPVAFSRCRYIFRRSSSLTRASLTIEAAVVLPLFFLACLTLFMFMDAIHMSVESSLSLSNKARQTAVAAALLPSQAEGDGIWIDLKKTVVYEHPFPVFNLPRIRIPVRAKVYPWIGSDRGVAGHAEGGDSGDSGETVYVTDNESVYHTHADCTHLDLTIIKTTVSAVKGMRNADGKRYKKCRGFPSGYNGPVYISARGTYYYPSPDYGSLTRHVHVVEHSEVGSLKQCERCAGRDAA